MEAWRLKMEPWRVSKRRGKRVWCVMAFFLLFISRLSSSRHSLQLQEHAKFATLTLSNWKGGGGTGLLSILPYGGEPHPEPHPLETSNFDKDNEKQCLGEG
jgi:hypothetical protein